MKNLKNIIFATILVLSAAGSVLHAKRETTKRVENPIERVDKEMSLLDQIMDQVNILMGPITPHGRVRTIEELTRLMEHEDLDVTIKDAIKNDIEIIKNPKTKPELRRAYKNIVEIYKKIDSQANVVEVIDEATKMVEDASFLKNASPEEIKEAIESAVKEARERIRKAEESEQSTLGRWYRRAQDVVAVPVDYVFGEENSYAKRMFYSAARLAMSMAAGAAVGYIAGRGVIKVREYMQPTGDMGFGGDERSSVKIIRSAWTPHMKENLKEQFGDDLQAQEEGLRGMLPALEAEKSRLMKYDESLNYQITAKEDELKHFIEYTPMPEAVRKFLKQASRGEGVKVTTGKEGSAVINQYFELGKINGSKIEAMKAQKSKNLFDLYKIDHLENYYGELKYRPHGESKKTKE